MELKGRLALIASFVPQCTSVCDVGTDHAYIPVYLVKIGICQKAIAMDINEGPLEAAKENIGYFNLSEKIETRLGNVLEHLQAEEADVIVIAGMGGLLIRDIIEASFDKAKAGNLLILQPMNAIEVLREYLYNNGFEIIDEALTNEELKIYNVMKVKWTGRVEPHEIIDYYIGEKLVEHGGDLFNEYMKRKIIQANKVLDGLSQSRESNEEYFKLHEYLKSNYTRIFEDCNREEK